MLNLQKKRRREFDEYEYRCCYDTNYVYFDYFILEERIIPIAIRIYNEKRKITDTYIYNTQQDELIKIRDLYNNRNKKPYWISFIGDTSEIFVIGLSKHFENYSINWLNSHNSVIDILRSTRVVLYTISNTIDMVEKFLDVEINEHIFITSEITYKVDFLSEKVTGIRINSVEMNNMSQSITSIHNSIVKVIQKYPDITKDIRWMNLRNLFQ